MMYSSAELMQGLDELVIFRRLNEQPVIGALQALFADNDGDKGRLIHDYCEFAARLFRESGSFTEYIKTFVFDDENVYVKSVLKGKIDAEIENRVKIELDFLGELAAFDGAQIREGLSTVIPLPKWKAEKTDLTAAYFERIAAIPQKGFGVWAKYHVFTVDDNGGLTPVRNPDKTTLDDLYGYKNERGKIAANTEVLLDGGKANNCLLYGDAGTGKSSTVKAIVNKYKDSGLRLIEIGKNQLYRLPEIMDMLADNPLKFIVFVDDLCFDSDDRDFSAFKAILEGSVNSRGDNILIYATSNHRHLVKERMSDRQADEINLNDTLQEISSLSARFGLTVTFERPGKALYGEIVCYFAKRNGIKFEETELVTRAEAFAIRSGGRNARVAKQFVELYKSGIIK